MKRTLSIFLALVMMLSCFAVCVVSGAVDVSTPACRCVAHNPADKDCSCCALCPNLNEDYLTKCVQDIYGKLDTKKLGKCYDIVNGEKKYVDCDECTGTLGCDCGHDCCHPCLGHNDAKTSNCECCIECPVLADKFKDNDKNDKLITNCVKDENGDLDVTKHGFCYDIIDGEKVLVKCDKCTGLAGCKCGHACCHSCVNHVEEKDACRCCVACPNLNPEMLKYITKCVRDKNGNLDASKLGVCYDENGKPVECEDCTGIWPCNCGHACCNPNEDLEEPSDGTILTPEQQENFTSGFQQFLQNVKNFFDNFFKVIFAILGITD